MTCVSGFFVDFKADDMLSAKSAVASPVFPRPSAYMYTECELQSVPRLSEESQLHIFSSTTQRKQSQSWRTESLQGSSGINRFDPYWKEKDLWEGGLWDITITEEAEGLCRSGSPEPRILADLAVTVRERFMLLVWPRSVWVCCPVLLHVSALHIFTMKEWRTHLLISGKRYFTLKIQTSYFSSWFLSGSNKTTVEYLLSRQQTHTARD